MNISQSFDPRQKWKTKFPFWNSWFFWTFEGMWSAWRRGQTCGHEGSLSNKRSGHKSTSIWTPGPSFPYSPSLLGRSLVFSLLLQTLKPVRLNLWPCFGRGANTRRICKGYVWVKVKLEVRTLQNNHGWIRTYKSAKENNRVICSGLKGQERQVPQLES